MRNFEFLRYKYYNTSPILLSRKILTISFILFLTNFSLIAQELKILEGQIISDSIAPSNVHVVNLNLKEGVISNGSGRFQIPAGVDDSLLFSSVQFENRIIRVKKDQYAAGKIEIKLFPARNELDEVSISDIRLSGVLGEDVAKIKIFDRTKFGIPYAKKGLNQIERQLHTATTSSGGIPLDPLLNTINGKIKMLKKARANDELTNSVHFVLNRFSKDFFVTELEIPDTEVLNFLYYCARDYNFAVFQDSGNNLELIEIFRKNVASFHEWRGVN